MTILTSANGSLPLTLRKGETLVIRNYSGAETVTGSTAAREDVSSTAGAGAVAYGPQSSAATLTISSSGSLDYSVVAGDMSPAVNALVSVPTGQIVTPSGDVVGGGGTTIKSVYRPLLKWREARLRGATNPARVLLYGESGVAGQGCGTGAQGLIGAATVGYGKKIADAIGGLYAGFLGENNSTVGSVTPSQYDPRLTLGTGWAADIAPAHCGGRFITASGATAGECAFAPGVPVSEFVFWYPRTSTAQAALEVRIDGVLVDTINQIGADALLSKTYSMALGLHTISFKATSTGTSFVLGVVSRDGTSAPIVMQAGNCGRNMSQISSAAFPWEPRPSAVALAPDLTVIKCTVNDSNAGTTRASYVASLESIMAALAPTSDLVLVISFPSDNANTFNGGLDALSRAIHDLAADFGASVVDTREVYGIKYSRAQARGLNFNADHGNSAGYDAEIAQLVGLLV